MDDSVTRRTQGAGGATGGTAVGAAVGLALFNVAVVALAAWVDVLATDTGRASLAVGHGWISGASGLALVAAGALILASGASRRIGLVLAGFGTLWCLDGLAESWAAYAVPLDLPGTDFAYWMFARLGAVLLLAIPLVLVLYPDGRLMAGGWGRFGAAVVAACVPLPVMLLLATDEIVFQGISVPESVDTELLALPLPDEVVVAVLRTGQVLVLLAMIGALVTVFVRHRRADDESRRRIRWLLWAGIVNALAVAILPLYPDGPVSEIALAAAVTVTSASVAIGVLRPDLADIDSLVANTLTFVVLAAVLVGLDLAVLGVGTTLLGDRLDERRVTVLVLVLAVLVYGPLRSWLGSLVRRLLFGWRGDRYGVVSQLAARLEQAGGLEGQLPALAGSVAKAFKVPYVRVEVVTPDGGTLSSTFGELRGETVEFTIAYGAEQVGRLVLPRDGLRSQLSRADQDLLVDLVRQAAIAIRSNMLARELQDSRERLVLAREEDRRRIRRDLHDGLGPVLSGVAMRLDAAVAVLDHDGPRGRELVRQSGVDITEALADIRRLVHGLRPPALDDLGLVSAIEQQAERMSGAVSVAVVATGVEALPAAVEVATYRIVSEALNNVVRHASARTARVEVLGPTQGSGRVVVRVCDDGVGIPQDVTAGVGLLSLRERAEELGGQCTVSCPPDGGTVVEAWLPCTTQDRAPSTMSRERSEAT